MSVSTFFYKPTNQFCLRINDGKVLPVVDYDQDKHTLVRRVKNEHFLRIYRGYAIHKELLDAMTKDVGETTPLVIETPKHRRYSATLKDWKEKGTLINFAGTQICLPVAKMSRQ